MKWEKMAGSASKINFGAKPKRFLSFLFFYCYCFLPASSCTVPYFTSTQCPLMQTKPGGQSLSIEHATLGRTCFNSSFCFLLWYKAQPAPTQISRGVQNPMSKAKVQLRKRFISTLLQISLAQSDTRFPLMNYIISPS